MQPMSAKGDCSGRDARSRRIRTSRTRGWQGGGALIVVLAVVVAVMLIGVALFALAGGESGIVERRTDSVRAFYLAEAGLDRAKAWLEALAQEDPPTFPDEATFGDQWLGGGEYDVELSKASTTNPWLTMYDVVSTATVDGAVRQVRSRLQNETFAQFVYFADQSSEIWFTDRDSLDGRVHVNGLIYISGDPWFGMKVTSTADHFVMYSGSNPTFEAGYELDVPSIPLPMPAELTPTLVAESQAGGLYGGVLSGTDAKYEVELGREREHGHHELPRLPPGGRLLPVERVDERAHLVHERHRLVRGADRHQGHPRRAADGGLRGRHQHHGQPALPRLDAGARAEPGVRRPPRPRVGEERRRVGQHART